MAAQQFANNAQTTLASICNPGDLTISVVSAAGFPTLVPYTILIDQEFMLVTSGASTTTWGVSRAQESTSAGTHAATAAVVQDWTVGGLQSLNQAYYPTWAVSGLAGALQASRYIGAVATGTPGSGTFGVGDWGIVQTGGIIVCTVAGSPGTWASILPQNFSTSYTTHLISTAPGPPTTSGLNANLSSATLLANSTDTKGAVSLVVSLTPITSGGSLCTVNFNTAYANANYSVQLTQSVANNPNTNFAVTTKATGGFVIWNSGAASLLASTTYQVDYLVIG